VFDAGQPYRCSPQVALRPEPFGALVYHFGTRQLSFLKTPELLDIVRSLEHHEDVGAAVDGAGVPPRRRAAYLQAMAGLAAAGTIEPR
jgi:putative mycofactocin binding protein MftB